MRNSTQYKLAGPKTFRRSSVKILHKWGSNLQNVEKSMRSLYIADGYGEQLKGKCKWWLETGDLSLFTEEELTNLRCMVQRDQSGAEALIVAYDCDAGAYRQLFIHGVKPHVYVAMKLFKDVWKAKLKEKGGLTEGLDMDKLADTPIDQLKANPFWYELDKLIKDSDNWSLQERYYYLAKQTVHSANYDIQAPTFRMNILEKSGGKIVIDLAQAKYFLNTYRELFPEIPESNRRIARQVEDCRIIFNIFGFPYQITDFNINESKLKEYYAWPRQSSVGEITRIAFSRFQEEIESEHLPYDILQDNHDSYLAQCPLHLVKDCIERTKKHMNQRLVSPTDGTVFHMKSECQVGFNWGPFDKNNPDKNPLGLRELTWV